MPGSIGWLGPAPRLRIAVIVSRFLNSFTKNFVICFYQVTKIFSTKLRLHHCVSCTAPCDFSPLADLAISFLREMSAIMVLTKIHMSLEYASTKILREKNLRQSLHVQWNFITHQFFSEFLQTLHDFRVCATRVGKHAVLSTTSHRSFCGSFFSGCWILFGLVNIGSPRPFINQKWLTVAGEMSLSVRSSRSRVFISLTVSDEDKLEENVEQ